MADWTVERFTVTLSEPFRIAHGATSQREILRVRWAGGVGEAPFVPYYREDPASTEAWTREFLLRSDPHAPLPRDAPKAARLALSLCRADSAAKERDLPLGASLGVSGNSPPACRSFGIPDDLAAFHRLVATTAERFPVLKLKLGSGDTGHDLRIVATARAAAPGAVIFADVNCGWTPREAAELIPRLPAHGIAFVEQPVGRDSLEPWRELAGLLPNPPLPLWADESAQTAADIGPLREFVSGVNVKLVKAGGLDRALEMITAAREAGLKVMLGCMIETSLGITAAAHLAPLVDGIDLDGHLYLAHDPWRGVEFSPEGRVLMPQRPGIGCVER